MSKQKTKTVAKNVGANCVRPHFEEIAKKQKGITLIALIITIIVMLILVGVSVTVALNGGLFSTAKQATSGTQLELDKEQLLSAVIGAINNKGKVDFDVLDNNLPEGFTKTGERTYTSKAGNTFTVLENAAITLAGQTGGGSGGPGGEEPEVVLPEGWTVAETKPEGWSENVTAITDGTNTIPLPNGFEISTETTEDEVSEGLVLKDGANEFVWIPVSSAASYTEDSFGPLTDTDSTSTYVYDSQEELDYYYGTDYYNYSDFTYEADKTKVEENIQTYGGFYVGRYETTIEGSTIGVQEGKTVLTAASILKEGTNTTSNDEYHYRWWGLYKVQKDMYANNSSVGSLMISNKQWNEIMTFTGYGDTIRETDTYTTKPDLSGSAYATDSTQYDVSKNIYDLAGNVTEFTLKAYSTYEHTSRGGYYTYNLYSASDTFRRSPSGGDTITR